MHVNVAIPEAQVSAPVLNAALESVTRLNEELIKNGTPTFKQALPKIRWKPEPPGQEHFDHANIVLKRGWGDCDDLASWHTASLRATGEDPGATPIVKRSGPNTWHAVTLRSDGKIDDPSIMAGMNRRHGIHGAWLPLMNAPVSGVNGAFALEPRPQIALRPAPAGFEARADLPWHWDQGEGELNPNEYAMATLHTAPTASQALVGALDGSVLLGECSGFAKADHLERLKCFADACEGVPYEELAAVYGEEHATAAQQVVGSFFKNFGRALASPFTSAAQFVKHPSLKTFGHMFTDPITSSLKTVQPIAKAIKPMGQLFRFVPGIGPVAATALDIASTVPTSLKDFGGIAARNAASFIPGIGPAISLAQQGIPGLQGEWPQMERFT